MILMGIACFFLGVVFGLMAIAIVSAGGKDDDE